MDHFAYRKGELYAEDVAVSKMADTVGTPFYCYSSATLTRHVNVFREALAELDPLICFAVKANSNLAVLKTLGTLGLGADVVSEGEARRAIAAGIAPGRIVFSGVGKTRDEMRYAIKQRILQFNVESEPELLALSEVASALGKRAYVAIRVNPDVDAKTHAKISTGKKENKFGVDIKVAPALFRKAMKLPGIEVVGVSVHIGSQLTSLKPFNDAYKRVRQLVEELRDAGVPIRTIDLGGGLGVPYNEEAPPSPKAYGQMVAKIFADCGARLIVEPGRLITANAGVLVTRVLYVKRSSRTYVIADAGMNDLLRPALYDAHHTIVPVRQARGKAVSFDLVGPVCESSDVFAKGVKLPLPKEGDLLILRTAGAYGATMANSYNSRLLVPEVLVNGKKFAVVRKRPSYDEMLAADSIPDWL